MIEQWLVTVSNWNSSTLIIALVGIVGIVAVSMLFRSQSRVAGLQQQLKKLERDLRISNGSAIGMGQQLIQIEKQLQQQKNAFMQQESKAASITTNTQTIRPSVVESVAVDKTSVDNAGSIYDQARQALAQGLAIDEIAQQCGLSYAEVSLLQTLSKSSISSPS